MTRHVAASLFQPRVRALLATTFDDRMLGHLERVFHATDHQLRQGGRTSHGALVYRLAIGLGWRPSQASDMGMLLDMLQPALDLADNLADEERDVAEGNAHYLPFYKGIARETLVCVPALLVGAVVAALPRLFPPDAFGTELASRRVLATLGAMAGGQGLPLHDEARNDAVSGQEGRLFCLPLWVQPDRSPAQAARIERAERWAVAYGRTWQLAIDVSERPGDAAAAVRLREAIAVVVQAWPDFAPFAAGGRFSAGAVLPKGWSS